MKVLTQRWSNRSIAGVAIAVMAVGGIAIAGPASAQMNRGDAKRGHELAERVCTGLPHRLAQFGEDGQP